jgi:hypothetical protein
MARGVEEENGRGSREKHTGNYEAALKRTKGQEGGTAKGSEKIARQTNARGQEETI